jgi:hypothetical protein
MATRYWCTRRCARSARSSVATGRGKRGKIGEASSVLVPADEIVAFGVAWLERWGRGR